MSDSFEIRGDKARLSVTVLGYERPGATSNVHDANWLRCTVGLAVGAFSAAIEAAFTTHDFVEFESQLRKGLSALDGSASWTPDEKALNLQVDFKRTGRVTVSGLAQTLDRPRAALSFSFDTDQTFVGQTADELRAIIKSFPIRRVDATA